MVEEQGGEQSGRWCDKDDRKRTDEGFDGFCGDNGCRKEINGFRPLRTEYHEEREVAAGIREQ